MEERRVAVTGVGMVTSLGCDRDEVWQALCDGKSGVSTITRWDPSRHGVRIAGEIKDFDPDRWIDRRESRRIDRFGHFAIAAADLAVTDSGIQFESEDRTRAGVMIGSGIGGLGVLEEQQERLKDKGPDRVSPFLIIKLMINAGSAQVSIRYNLKGPNSSTVTASASASNAIGDALRIIQRGDADIMVAGGAEAAITPLGMAGFISMNALSTRNDDPPAASRPFDKNRDGFVMGEGAGVLILEELERAKARGAHIYAEFRGYAMSGDGFHMVQPDPSADGAVRAMKGAIDDAGMQPSDITYLNAHGTSTPYNDAMESTAAKKVFGDHISTLAISSTKSMIGHLLGASGGVEAVFSCLAIDRDIIPPTINYETPDPECDIDCVPNVARKCEVYAAMSNTLGFGGHNATLLFSKYPND